MRAPQRSLRSYHLHAAHLRPKKTFHGVRMHAAVAELIVTQEMLQVAQQLADAAAKETKPLFRAKQALITEIKTDQSPVTEADKNAELAMRSIVQQELPQHAIFGEEFGFSPGAGALPSSSKCLLHAGRPFFTPLRTLTVISSVAKKFNFALPLVVGMLLATPALAQLHLHNCVAASATVLHINLLTCCQPI